MTAVKRERKPVVLRLRHFREVVRKDIKHVIFPDGKEVFTVNLLNELKSKRAQKGNYVGSSSSSPDGAEHLFDSSNERLIQNK